MDFTHRYKYLGFRVRTLKILLFCIMAFIVSSCGPLPTNWQFVNQSKVDRLLQSPETINIEDKDYELIVRTLIPAQNQQGVDIFIIKNQV